MASKTSETWAVILQLATSGMSSYFWSSAEGTSLLVSRHYAKMSSPSQERKIPQSRASLPLSKEGKSITMLIKSLREVPCSYPECSFQPFPLRAGCTLPPQLVKLRSWAITGKGLVLSIYAASLQKVNCTIIHSFY